MYFYERMIPGSLVMLNKSRQKKTVMGFHGGRITLQYRIVQPVFYRDEYIGAVQFGIKAGFVVSALRDKLGTVAGMAVLNDNFVGSSNNSASRYRGKTHTICSQNVGIFNCEDNAIDWKQEQQPIVISGHPYILINVLPLLNFRSEELGFFFVAIDLSDELGQKQRLLGTVILLSIFVLITSFVILYWSYGSLVQRILNLNSSLEKNNLELEDRVRERTVSLQESEQRLQEILDKAPVGILIADVISQRFQYANPTSCELLGYSKEELENLGLQNVHSPEKLPFVVEQFTEIQLEKRTIAPDIPFIRKDGTEFEVDIISAPLQLEGRPCVVGFIVDRSQSKKLVKQLHRAQKMEAIGLMAGGVAHDLNNILSGVVSYPELLLMKLPLDSDMRKPLTAIMESGKRAAAVVADLLTVARGVAGTREPHDVNKLIQKHLLSPECQKTKSFYPLLICDDLLEAEDAIISCSPMHIQKSIMNLLNNAMEAAGEAGHVTISTTNSQVDKSEDDTFAISPGKYVLITIEDNGSGIADNDLEHIFEPFYTKKEMGRSGTGLGLTVVWNTVHDHNGKIVVESSEKGTRFLLYFPVDSAGDVAEIPEAVRGIPFGNGETILVVDDEPQLRDIASEILNGLGYRVESVCSGELALKFLQENPVDLVVIDMLMEPGMNGRQAYEQMLVLHPDQKAIIVSGFSESDDVKAALQQGAGGFIKKPYSMEELARAVKLALIA